MTKANGLGPGTIVIEDESYGTFSFEHEGTKFTVRELSVDEGDDAADASTDDKGKFNGRLNTRLVLSKALVEPKVTVDDIGKFGSRKYQLVLGHFNRLNTLPVEVPTPPAGSAGPTSPDGGEPLPTA